MTSSQFQFNDITTHYSVSGGGPWIVLCHALASNSDIWNHQVSTLGKHFSILTFDLPGHGKSPERSDGNYSFEALAENLIALMDYLGIESAHLAGISIGGEVAQVAAANYPSRFRKLVLISTACVTNPDRFKIWEERINEIQKIGMADIVVATTKRWFSENFYREHPEIVKECETRISQTSLAAYISLARVIQKMDLRKQISTIHIPTLVMYGDNDHNTGRIAAGHIRSWIPHATIDCILNAGHFPILEQHEDINQKLLAFLQK